ncbi:hypothetical protein YC2023_031700 [Brassica napus]
MSNPYIHEFSFPIVKKVSFKVRKEETSKKKRRLSAKKRKCRRRLVFAIITDIELVAIYTCPRRPCFSFSDSILPVDKAEELDGGGDNKIVVWLEDVGALMTTNPMREGATGYRTAIYEPGGGKASSLTNHYRKQRRLRFLLSQPRCLIQPQRSNNSAVTTYIALYGRLNENTEPNSYDVFER